jgi:hypothetical protein
MALAVSYVPNSLAQRAEKNVDVLYRGTSPMKNAHPPIIPLGP